jgi:hypothetical protein
VVALSVRTEAPLIDIESTGQAPPKLPIVPFIVTVDEVGGAAAQPATVG